MKKFLETIRFENGEFQLLDFHQERINRTFASFYQSVPPLLLRECLPDFSEAGKFKFRFEYDSISYQLESKVYQPKTIQTIELVETNMDYNFKFTDRSEIRKLLDQSSADEIIIVKNDLITDSSYSNLAFFDGSDWWTPEEPLLVGVRRANLLDNNQIKTAKIRVDDLVKFEKISLINAMLDLDELVVSAEVV